MAQLRLPRWLILAVWVGLMVVSTGAQGRAEGLLANRGGAYEGYTLFSPMTAQRTYLINMNGEVVPRWQADTPPGHSAYLLEDGSLLRSGNIPNPSFSGGGGGGGVIEKYNWDGERQWRYEFNDERVRTHHDIEPLPNGNVLAIAWEYFNEEEALAAGRNPELLLAPSTAPNPAEAYSDFFPMPPQQLALSSERQLWFEKVIEIEAATGNVVWEWRSWDHLVQDVDPTKANFGVVEDSRGKIDINYVHQGQAVIDAVHFNSIDYHAARGEILLSPRNYHEIWVIDHDLTTAEAAGPAGDLLYRWGNPAAYGRGELENQQLFGAHDAQWIPDGYPGAGNITLFNNGMRLLRPFTTVDELIPPLDEAGNYVLGAAGTYGPDEPFWQYSAGDAFYAPFISSAQRLPNGNTLITNGVIGRAFETTIDGAIVWDYVLPRRLAPQPNATPERPRPVMVFRTTRYGADYPAFEGRDLSAN